MGDLDGYGRVPTEATEAQAALPPALISDAAVELLEIGRSCGAAGWKVNGAGGGGGSITLFALHPPIVTGSSTRPDGGATRRSRSCLTRQGARTIEGAAPHPGAAPSA